MTSFAETRNDLEARLADLEKWGLARPANVLFTEYVDALVAEAVIDAETGARLSAAYHASHYGTIDLDDPNLQQPIARLENASTVLAAMSGDARQELVERFRDRLQLAPNRDVRWPSQKEAVSPAPSETAAGLFGNGHASPGRVVAEIDTHLSDELASDSDASAATNRRRPWGRSIPLEAAAVAAVVLFFAGYSARNVIEQAAAQPSGETGPYARSKITPRTVWEDDQAWMGNLRRRAQKEAREKKDRNARFAYELLISYRPNDSFALKDLAWLYLTSPDPELHNLERGRELARRALARDRRTDTLDTAAEAEFQSGNIDRAIQLEKEALGHSPKAFSNDQRREYFDFLRSQMDRFQAAAVARASKSEPAGKAPDAASPNRPPRANPTRTK